MSTATGFAPLAAATGEPVRLAMQRLWLAGQVLPVGGRLVVFGMAVRFALAV